MLIYLLRYGRPTFLIPRGIRNGSSTATYGGSGTLSRPEEKEIDGWATAAGNQGRQSSKKTESNRSDKTWVDHVTKEAPLRPKRRWVKDEPGANGDLAYGPRLKDRIDERLPELQKNTDSDRISLPSEGVQSKQTVLSGTKTASFKPTTTGKRPWLDSEDELALGSKADSSFLDGLVEDKLTKKADDVLKKPVSLAEKVSKLREFLMADDSQALLLYMASESEDMEFMRAIPAVTFVELLRRIQPGDDFSPFRSDHKGRGPKHYWMLTTWRRNFYNTLHRRRQFYRDIAMRRVESGLKLGIGEYTQLLNLARLTWDGPMALDIMKQMIANEVQPNLNCYNHFFEARCWSDTYHPDEMQRLRVIPHNMEMRKTTPSRMDPNDVLIDGHRVDENGIRWEVTRMFTKMMDEGINADTRAYCNLITALSREGDLRAIKSVLQRVWDVDIDALLAGRLESDEEQKLKEDSPTYPTQELLYILAHAFGSNSDVPAAIRIVDHFSRKYNITISQAVWGELMEWTFVLSAPRRKIRRTDGTAAGQLPLRSVEDLWSVMLGPPYHSEPNLRMYDFLLRSFWRRKANHRSLSEFIKHMREGIKFHEQAFDSYRNSRTRIRSFSVEDDELDPAEFNSQQIEATKAWNDRWFSYAMVRKWFELLLCNQRWFQHRKEREELWVRKMLPDAVKEFWRFKGHKPIKYITATGRVELEDPVEKEARANAYVERRNEASRNIPSSGIRYGVGNYTGDGEETAFVPDDDWEDEAQKILGEEDGAEEEGWDEREADGMPKRRDDP